MSRRYTSRMLVWGLMLTLAAAPAHSAIIATYLTAQALENASDSPDRLTFETVAEGPYNQMSGWLNADSVYGALQVQAYWTEFSSTNFLVPIVATPSWTGRHVEGPSTNLENSHLRVYLPGSGNITFVGANLMLSDGSAGPVRVRVQDHEGNWYQQDLTTLSTTGQTEGYSNAAFLGLRFDRPVVEWRVYSLDPANRILFDNLYVAQNAAAGPPPPPPPPPAGTPDAATHLLCGGGILLIAARHWWRKRQAASAAPLMVISRP